MTSVLGQAGIDVTAQTVTSKPRNTRARNMDSAPRPQAADGYEALRRIDPVLDRLIIEYGTPDPFQFPDGGRTTGSNFSGMVLHIVAQQISTHVALIIYDRMVAEIEKPPTPERVLALSLEQLRSFGMSHSKAAYLHNLADDVLAGTLRIESLETLGDQQAVDALTHVKGVGPWSAEMFLIHQLRRPDVLPAGDLGIRTAIQHQYELADLPSIEDVRRRGSAWSPYRTYAAALLWRSLPQVGKRVEGIQDAHARDQRG